MVHGRHGVSLHWLRRIGTSYLLPVWFALFSIYHLGWISQSGSARAGRPHRWPPAEGLAGALKVYAILPMLAERRWRGLAAFGLIASPRCHCGWNGTPPG